jgi:hypothetical protein
MSALVEAAVMLPPEHPKAWLRLNRLVGILFAYIPSQIGRWIDVALGWSVSTSSSESSPVQVILSFLPAVVGSLVGGLLDYSLRLPGWIGYVIDRLLLSMGVGFLFSKTLVNAFESAKRFIAHLLGEAIPRANETYWGMDGLLGFSLGLIPRLLEYASFRLIIAFLSAPAFVSHRISAPRKERQAGRENALKLIQEKVDLFAALRITPDNYESQKEQVVASFVNKAFQAVGATCHPDKSVMLPTAEREAAERRFDIATQAKIILEKKHSPQARLYCERYAEIIQWKRWVVATCPSLLFFYNKSQGIMSPLAIKASPSQPQTATKHSMA